MKVFSKQNLYLTMWLMLGFWFTILTMSVIALISYYYISFDPARYWQNSQQIVIIGGVTWCALSLVNSYLAIALGRISWQKIYVEGIRGKKYILKK